MWQVVDVGGGTGFCTQGIVKTVSPENVVLMDQSPQQLAKARKKKDLQGVNIVEVCPLKDECRIGRLPEWLAGNGMQHEE